MPRIDLVENPRRRKRRKRSGGSHRRRRRRNPELAVLNPRRKRRRRGRRRSFGRRKYSIYARRNPALRLPLIGALPVTDILYVGGGFVGTKIASGFVKKQAANLLKTAGDNPFLNVIFNALTAFGLSKVAGMVFRSKEAEKMVFVGGLSSVAVELAGRLIPGLAVSGLGAEVIPESDFEGLNYFEPEAGMSYFEPFSSFSGNGEGDEWMNRRQMAFAVPGF